MNCYIQFVNLGKTDGKSYCFNNVGQAKLIALVNLRKFNGVAILKVAGKARKFFVLGADNKLVEIGEKSAQEHIDLIEETIDRRVFEKEVEYVERFYGVPTEPGMILFKLEEEGAKKPSLWQKIIKTIKSWF